MSTTKRNVLLIAARIGADPRTVEKALRGGSVLGPVRFAVEAAARELGIALPASPSAPPSTPEGAVAA